VYDLILIVILKVMMMMMMFCYSASATARPSHSHSDSALCSDSILFLKHMPNLNPARVKLFKFQ